MTPPEGRMPGTWQEAGMRYGDDREADPPPAQNTQIVMAVNGFAYGVIGADIHVFVGGLPLYLLTNWPPVPQADPAWLREPPSRMLNASRAAVPFTGRDAELAEMRQWRDEDGKL